MMGQTMIDPHGLARGDLSSEHGEQGSARAGVSVM
jgi:hypothetical protein